MRRQGLLPENGSPAQVEHRDFSREESVRTLIGQISMLVEIGADQLTAFIKTISEPLAPRRQPLNVIRYARQV